MILPGSSYAGSYRLSGIETAPPTIPANAPVDVDVTVTVFRRLDVSVPLVGAPRSGATRQPQMSRVLTGVA